MGAAESRTVDVADDLRAVVAVLRSREVKLLKLVVIPVR